MPKKDALSALDLRRLLLSAESPRDKLILALAGILGLRTCEISRLSQNHIVRDNEKVPVGIKIIGKGRKQADQAMLIPRELRHLLPSSPGPLVISHRKQSLGSRLSPRSIQWIIAQHLARAGLASTRITPHSLRHTAARIALDQGADLERIRVFLRHKDPATTLAYLQLLADHLPPSTEAIVAQAVLPLPPDPRHAAYIPLRR